MFRKKVAEVVAPAKPSMSVYDGKPREAMTSIIGDGKRVIISSTRIDGLKVDVYVDKIYARAIAYLLLSESELL